MHRPLILIYKYSKENGVYIFTKFISDPSCMVLFCSMQWAMHRFLLNFCCNIIMWARICRLQCMSADTSMRFMQLINTGLLRWYLYNIIGMQLNILLLKLWADYLLQVYDLNISTAWCMIYNWVDWCLKLYSNWTVSEQSMLWLGKKLSKIWSMSNYLRLIACISTEQPDIMRGY